MMVGSYICLLLSLILVALAQAQNHGRRLQSRQLQPAVELLEKEIERPKVYETHREISPNAGDGNFRYYSATSDGLESEQVGHFNNPYQSQVHQGSYTTKNEFDQVVRVDYVADKDGFRPIGPNGAASLPQAPLEPIELIEAREKILRQQKEIRDQHLGYLRAGYVAAGVAHGRR